MTATIMAGGTPTVAGLTEAEQAECAELFRVWRAKQPRNALRTTYYDAHNRLRDLGISIPPGLRGVPSVVGWPAKAVDALASRSIFDGFVAPGDTADALGLAPVLEQNNFDLLYEQAVVSQLTHSVAFLTVSLGDTVVGDPEILVSLRGAEFAAATWDSRRRRLRAGFAVTRADKSGAPVEFVLYFAHAVVTCEYAGGWQVSDRREHRLGVPPIIAMPCQPSERRPFGRSRITREVMALADSAMRAALRAEILMEFNTAPHRYVMGADEDAFKGGKWQAYMDMILGLSPNEDGGVPTVGQFPQLSPQGAISYLEHLAKRFSGATGVPLSALGIVQDNPASAEAMAAARDELIVLAQGLNRTNGAALRMLARMIIGVRDGLPVYGLPDEVSRLDAAFRNPAMPSIVSQSDAMVKQITAIPWLAETDVALEQLGYSRADITRMRSDKQRASGGSLLDQVLSRAGGRDDDKTKPEQAADGA